jgi:hypothetical protein
MKPPIEISAELQEWAASAGYELTPGTTTADGRAIFWADGGEIRHFVGVGDDGWFYVNDSDRLGPEYLDLAAPSMATIETYFFGKFGRFIRSREQLPRVRMPIGKGDLSVGFELSTKVYAGSDRFALIGPSGSEVAISSGDEFSATAELAKLSLYLTASTKEIMSSYLNPSGQPLFSVQ